MRKAFTLMELVVALAILAVMLSFAGVIFRVSIESHRLALANAEIMQKLRVITDQLDADFRSLRKDGEIFVVLAARRKPDYTGANPNSSLAFDRFDRIMFFTSGDFQTYGANPRWGNVARICYTVARGPSGDHNGPYGKPHKRILARTQHILIPPEKSEDRLDVSKFAAADWVRWNRREQVDNISLEGWKRIPLADKSNMLSVIGDITIGDIPIGGGDRLPPSTTTEEARGVLIDRSDPNSIHSLFCRGVGQFMVQGWYGKYYVQDPNDGRDPWIPQVNPDEDSELDDDSDFLLTTDGSDVHPTDMPALWYPRGRGNIVNAEYPADQIDEEHFNEIPGLGRALKFTFTLYDSRNLIKNGRTFTHIVYLDN